MNTLERAEIEKALSELVERTPPSEWLQNMIEHYRRTGTFRPEDLRRLLGDPNKGIRIGPDSTAEALFACYQRDQS